MGGYGGPRFPGRGGSGGNPYRVRFPTPFLQQSQSQFSAPAQGVPYGTSSVPTKPIVPGPLDIYQFDKGRAYQNIGKFGVNLMPPAHGPGRPDAMNLAAPSMPRQPFEEAGFFEGLLGGVAGFTGNEAVAGLGRFVGSVVDLPMEAIGNVAGLPLAVLSSLPVHMRPGGIDPDIMEQYNQSTRDNPLNGILMYSHAAKSQWSRDVQAGRMTGLMGDVGPAVALTDQLGLAMQVLLAKPQQAIMRAFGGAALPSIEAIEEAARSAGPDEEISNPFYQELQQRLERGDFGTIGARTTRDKLMDEIVVRNQLLRDAGDPDQEGLVTGQGLADIAVSLATDPWLILGGVSGLASKSLKAGQMARSAKFLQLFGDPAAVEQEMAEAAVRLVPQLGDVNRARAAMQADPGLQFQAMREVGSQSKYASQFNEAMDAASYIQKWNQTWEPALRPVMATIRTLNDPQRLFGVGAPGKLADTIFSSHTAEGVLRAYDLDTFVGVRDALNALPNETGARAQRGLGVYVSNLTRTYFRNGLVDDIRRRGTVDFAHTPDELIEAGQRGVRGKDVADDIEQLALRVKPLYLDRTEGGLVRAREEARKRLELLGASPDEAVELSAKLDRDGAALIDAAYFGHTTEEFLAARDMAIKSALPDAERLTPIGPRQLTMQGARGVLDKLDNGDMDAVRADVERYGDLFSNVAADQSDADLRQQVTALLTDWIDNNALPAELTDAQIAKLGPGLGDWVARNSDLGYRPALRPEQMWRVTEADGQVVGISAWTELIGTASDIKPYNRFTVAKDFLFHEVRGTRIMNDARIRMAQHLSSKYGIPQDRANALFSRVIRFSRENNVTPRGLDGEQIWNLVRTHGLPQDIQDAIGHRGAVEALNIAFEGRTRHVGATQKFTGKLKSGMGGQTNWLGVMTEKIYPLVRFTLNPLFQMQELMEPFILNIMRGVKPGFQPDTVMVNGEKFSYDEQTLHLADMLFRDSKYAPADQIEYGRSALWGAEAGRKLMGPSTRLGKLGNMLSVGGRLNVKRVKEVNTARALRRELGKRLTDSWAQVDPSFMPKMMAHYKTDDAGEVGVRWLLEKASRGLAGPDLQNYDNFIELLKAPDLGERAAIDLDGVVTMFEDVETVADLQLRVRSGELTQDIFRNRMIEKGAHPEYVNRAWSTASSPYSPEEWWAHYTDTLGLSDPKATESARAFFTARAATMGKPEHELLATLMADVPMGIDERALAALDATQRKVFQFMHRAADASEGVPTSVSAAIDNFRKKTRFADREHFAIIDADGNILAEGLQDEGWLQHPNGMVTGAGLGDEINPHLPLLREGNHILIHNHPSLNPFSPADMGTAAQYDAAELWITAPGVTHRLLPPQGLFGRGSFREGLEDIIGEVPPDVPPTGLSLDEAMATMDSADEYWNEVRSWINTEWRAAANADYRHLRATSNYYYGDPDEDWLAGFDSIATTSGVQRVADQLGWEYQAVRDFNLPTDPVELAEAHRAFAANPPVHLAQKYPAHFASLPPEVHPLAGQTTAFEYDTKYLDWLIDLPDDGKRVAMDTVENFMRAELAPALHVGVADVRRAEGGWISPPGDFYENVNSVHEVFGSREGERAYAASLTYLLRQAEVYGSRVKAGRTVANHAVGERWALHYTADRALTDAEASELQRAISKATPALRGQGSMVVTRTDGRTAIQFIRDIDRTEGSVVLDDFYTDELEAELLTADLSAFDYSVEVNPDVVDFTRVSHDWEADPSGQALLAEIRQYAPDVAGQLERGLGERFTNVLGDAIRRQAPDAFDARIAELRASGQSVPDFRVPGEYAAQPLAGRPTLHLYGGRDWVRNRGRMTLWDKQGYKSQRPNPSQVYSSDPDLWLDLMHGVWDSVAKNISGSHARFNMFGWAAHTANAGLEATEGAFARQRMLVGGMGDEFDRAIRIRNTLPPAYKSDESALGMAFQLDEGGYMPSLHTAHMRWLDAEQRTAVDDFARNANERMRAATSDEQREQVARTLQAQLDSADGLNKSSRSLSVTVTPYPTATITTGMYAESELSDFVAVANPNLRYRGSNTSRTWGRVIKWLTEGPWTDESEEVQLFLQQQDWESMDQYVMRMASVLPGIDMKTALLAGQTVSPAGMTRAALDTHGVRYTVSMAHKRGELGRYPLPDPPGSSKARPGKIRAYHYTRDIDAVQRNGLDVKHAKGETYGEPNAIWFSTAMPDPDSTNFVEVWIDPSEVDIGSPAGGMFDPRYADRFTPEQIQEQIDLMHARSSNFTVKTAQIKPRRFTTVSRPRYQRARYLDENVPPGEGVDASQFDYMLDDPDYAWAINEWKKGFGPPGLTDGLSRGYARRLHDELDRVLAGGKSAFPSPEARNISLVSGKYLKMEWGPEKLAHMRSRLGLISDSAKREMYDNEDVLRHVAATNGKVMEWGGDYQRMWDYFDGPLRQHEVDRLRGAGYEAAADDVAQLPGGQWQWLKFDHVRGDQGIPFDPHVSITRGIESMPKRSPYDLDQSIGLTRRRSPQDPSFSMLFHEQDGAYLGANVMMDDARRILLATQKTNAKTGLHEITHALEATLDPSQKQVIINEFRAATGSQRRVWHPDMSEWFADQMEVYLRSMQAGHPLRGPFEYVRRQWNRMDKTAQQRFLSAQTQRARNQAIAKGRRAVERTKAPLREANNELRAAERIEANERTALTRARRRTQADVLEARHGEAMDRLTQLEEAAKNAEGALRTAEAEAAQAEARRQAAAGTRSAGNLGRTAARRRASAEAASAEIKRLKGELKRARKATSDTGAKMRGARRRTPLTDLEQKAKAASEARIKAAAKQAKAQDAADRAAKTLEEGRAMPSKPPPASVSLAPISDAMRKLGDELTIPARPELPKTGPGSSIDIGTHYNLQEEALYQSAKYAFSAAEDNAFALHYYRRGRNTLERSINHPYLGLYPASYMWGKILPELTRFLVRTPFGIEAPLGGLALSNNIYRQVMMQQQYDEDFRREMVEREDFFHLLAMLTPALPWEIPVNAPLWARRVAEADAEHVQAMASGDPDAPLQNLETFGETVREMGNYAFGPASAATTATAGISQAFGLGDAVFQQASNQISNILNAGHTGVPISQQAAPFVPPEAVEPEEAFSQLAQQPYVAP